MARLLAKTAWMAARDSPHFRHLLGSFTMLVQVLGMIHIKSETCDRPVETVQLMTTLLICMV